MTQQAFVVSAGPEPACIKAYKAAGLGRRGLWSFLQWNMAKALAQMKPVPDINQISMLSRADAPADALKSQCHHNLRWKRFFPNVVICAFINFLSLLPL